MVVNIDSFNERCNNVKFLHKLEVNKKKKGDLENQISNNKFRNNEEQLTISSCKKYYQKCLDNLLKGIPVVLVNKSNLIKLSMHLLDNDLTIFLLHFTEKKKKIYKINQISILDKGLDKFNITCVEKITGKKKNYFERSLTFKFHHQTLPLIFSDSETKRMVEFVLTVLIHANKS